VAEDRKLVDSIATIAEHLKSVAPRKKTSHFEYMQARRKRNKLTRKVFMSGIEVRPRQLSDEQIDLLNRLQPGVYNGGRWTVIGRHADGIEGGSIEIYARNKTIEDRTQMAIEAPSLDVLLQKMIAEAEKKAA
jgi:hypothetical protein